MTEQNKSLYSRKAFVESYARKKHLQKPEQSILTFLQNNNVSGNMLDIGIGTGRTTVFFHRQFVEYTGIDYAEEMVNYCNKALKYSNVRFMHMDARNMKYFKDNTFDFVFFSFNGIDCIPYKDRETVLNEMMRVLNPCGYFAFSTHNLFYIPIMFRFTFPKNPLNWIPELKRVKIIREKNPGYEELIMSPYVEIYDGELDFEAKVIYIDPLSQLKQLEEMGVNNVKVFSFKTGREVPIDTPWNKTRDEWFYFLCQKTMNG